MRTSPARVLIIALMGCGPSTTPSESTTPSSSAPAVEVAPLPEADASREWTHNAARWTVARRTFEDPAQMQTRVSPGHGLIVSISNHESVIVCSEQVMVERIEESGPVEVDVIDDLPAMIEGVLLLDAEDAEAFLCHGEEPVCVQGGRLYVFAGEHLARVFQEHDYDVGSYEEADEREWILDEIRRRANPEATMCAEAMDAAAGG